MKSQRRLCIVYWDMGLGGIQKRIRDIVTDLSKNYPGWDVCVLLRRRSKDGLDSQIIGLKRVTVSYYDVNSPLRVPMGFVYWVGWNYIVFHPDVILTFHSLLSTVLVIFRFLFFWIRPKLIINEGAVTSQALAIIHKSYYWPLIRFAYPRANRIIVPTQSCKDDLIISYGIDKGKIVIVPNWTLYPPHIQLSPIYNILYVGRFDPEKNPIFMVKLTESLVKSYTNLRVGMIGSGILRSELLEKISAANLQKHIQLIPFSPDISSILRRALVLVVPSLNEGMPNVVLEAAMCKVPSVVHAFLGSAEVVHNGKTGFIYESLDQAVHHIDELLAYPRKRQVMGQNARELIAANFSRSTQQKFINIVLS